MEALGIDIGGSGIKAAVVDISTGKFISERIRVPVDNLLKPSEAVVSIKNIIDKLDYKGLIGSGFPSPIMNGVALTAANIDKSWIGKNIEELFSDATGCKVYAINDADAAGIAEVTFGAGKNQKGVILVLTLGTGIGSALFLDGHLLPNTELGHLEIQNKEAEKRASAAVRKKKKLSWKAWAERLDEYLEKIEQLIHPDLIVIGGGISKDFCKFSSMIKVETKILPAMLLNQAGIVGAAYNAYWRNLI